MARLLGPDGCPWDREQTLGSLRPYIVEEAFEVADAIDRESPDGIREELGDQLFLVVFASAIANARGLFSLDEVIDGISEKMVRRHPWVFGEERGLTIDGAMARWEAQKATEKRANGALAVSGEAAGVEVAPSRMEVGENAVVRLPGELDAFDLKFLPPAVVRGEVVEFGIENGDG